MIPAQAIDASPLRVPANGPGTSSLTDPPQAPGKRTFEIVAIAASAGGLRALETILAAIEAGFPAPILVVQHLSRSRASLMAPILRRSTALAVNQAEEGEQILPGCVYIAPPDHHLLVRSDRTLSLTHTELVHFVRPSADILFESVAAGFGPRAIAVVVTGTGFDGAAGVQAVKKAGGVVVVQDEHSSEFFGMPGAAINTGDADFIVPLSQIGSVLTSLLEETN